MSGRNRHTRSSFSQHNALIPERLKSLQRLYYVCQRGTLFCFYCWIMICSLTGLKSISSPTERNKFTHMKLHLPALYKVSSSTLNIYQTSHQHGLFLSLHVFRNTFKTFFLIFFQFFSQLFPRHFSDLISDIFHTFFRTFFRLLFQLFS